MQRGRLLQSPQVSDPRRALRKGVLNCLAVLSLAAMPCLAQNPLSQQILSAKTVFVTGGTSDLLDIAAGELNKWGRFQVVAIRKEADVVFDFGLNWQPSQVAVETLAITDARTGEMLYQGERVGHLAPWPRLTRSLLTDLRGRIELQSTIQFGTRAAKYFTDAALLTAKKARIWPSSADTWNNVAMKQKNFAHQLLKWNFDAAKLNLTAEDLGTRHNLAAVEKYRDGILTYTCQQLKLEAQIDRLMPARDSLPPDVVQALDAVEVDEAALSADCSSELAMRLLKMQAEKPPSR
jgi:hypothetical protein